MLEKKLNNTSWYIGVSVITLAVIFMIYKIYKFNPHKILHFPFKEDCVKRKGVLQLDENGILLDCADIRDYKPLKDIQESDYLYIINNFNKENVRTEFEKLKTYLTIHYQLLDQQPPDVNTLSDNQLRNLYNNLPFHWKLPSYIMPKTHILNSELQHIQKNIANQIYNPKSEREKLILYFQIVYPNINSSKLTGFSDEKLVKMYQKLEFYYKLPDKIMPKTPIIIRRPDKIKFYRVPDGVIMQQDPNKTASTTHYIEVTRFGPSNNLYRDPSKFTGTFWYPVRGSGLFLPLNNSLVAYNKIHALKLMGVRNEEIVKYAGNYFQYFLQKDTAGILKLKGNYDELKTTCVVTKNQVNIKNDECYKTIGEYSKKIQYLPEALNKIIEEIGSGKSLRLSRREGGKFTQSGPIVKAYYGLGDVGDEFLAGLAKQKGIEIIQLLREPQMKSEGDAVIGMEIIHLLEPVFSQAYLMRLDPLDPLIYKRNNEALNHNIVFGQPTNYLFDTSIQGVDLHLLSAENTNIPENFDEYVVDRKDY